jgi:hypothetical protein
MFGFLGAYYPPNPEKINFLFPIMHTYLPTIIFLTFLFCFSQQLSAQEDRTLLTDYPEMKKWFFPTDGAYLHQFASDLDDGGSLSVNRFYIQTGSTFSPKPQQSISLVVGYEFNGYDFSEENNRAIPLFWDDIHSLRISLPVRWRKNSRWTLFAAPSIRFTGEQSADWGEAATAGGFAGFSYRINDRLIIGPGIGIFSQLEESTSFFPILLISWKITDRLSLRTGRGLAATLGPGLILNWKYTDTLEFHAGCRYEKLRFRLDDNGQAPEGIGEDTSFPLVFGATYHFNHNARLTLAGGAAFGGELRLEDDIGRLRVKDHHDPAPLLGLIFHYQM